MALSLVVARSSSHTIVCITIATAIQSHQARVFSTAVRISIEGVQACISLYEPFALIIFKSLTMPLAIPEPYRVMVLRILHSQQTFEDSNNQIVKRNSPNNSTGCIHA